MAEKPKTEVNKVKLLDCILGPGAKSSLSLPFDLKKVQRAAIRTVITYPPKETGDVVVHARVSFDGKMFDDQYFSIYTICGPDVDSFTAPPPEEQKEPVTIDHLWNLCSPLIAASYIAVIVENASCPKAVIAEVEGLWIPYSKETE